MKNIIWMGLLALFSTACSGLQTAADTTHKTEKVKYEKIRIVRAAKFSQFIQNSHQLVDVRTAEEFEEGHIGQALNLDIWSDEFDQGTENLDKEEAVFLYCGTGKRSHEAALRLKELGFKYIYELKGGFEAWEKSKYHVGGN